MHFHAENRNFDLPCMASKYIQPKSNQNVTENDTQLLSVKWYTTIISNDTQLLSVMIHNYYQ